MPDMERILRRLSIDMAKDEATRELLRAEYRGEDRARKEILVIVIILTVIGVAFAAIFK